ncbi:unnamed protein product, partial [Prorocentrum cordatum]
MASSSQGCGSQPPEPPRAAGATLDEGTLNAIEFKRQVARKLRQFKHETPRLGMCIYFVVSILALSSLNTGRTIAFSLITELPSPHWRNYFLSFGSEVFTMGRGVGPILAGCIADRRVLIGVCAVSAWWVGHAWARGALEHEEHELGPARAELGEAPLEQEAEPTMMDEIRKDIDEWWSAFEWWASTSAPSGATPSRREGGTPAAKAR